MGHIPGVAALRNEGADFLSMIFGFRDSGRGRRLTAIAEARHADERAACAAAQQALLCGAVGAVVAAPGAKGQGGRGPKPAVLHRFGQIPAPIRAATARVAV